MKTTAPRHVPVMVEEAITYLAPQRGGLFVDCTVGFAGHAAALLERAPRARLLGLDRDREALAEAGERLAPFGDRARLVAAPFSRLPEVLGGDRPAGILADLGVSSYQLEEARRGFSFQHDGPLDMRMGQEGPTAAEVIADYPEEELSKVIHEYGEERMARRIARTLVRERQRRSIETTGELRDIVHRAKGRSREGRIDSATRVFQALRIEVNRELAELETLLAEAGRLLELEGRLVIISYHSLEDRLVKWRLRDLSRGELDRVTGRPREETRLLELLTRKAVRPRPEEVAANPRARSARLRAAMRRGAAE